MNDTSQKLSSAEVKELIDLCINHDSAYNKSSKLLLPRVAYGDKTVISPIVEKVGAVLENKKEQANHKILALYLLKECMDTRHVEIMTEVQKKLIKKLGKIPVNAAKYFPKDTDEKKIAVFNNLLLECIFHWALWFPSDTKTQKPTEYKKVFDTLKATVTFPMTFEHFGPKKEKKRDPSPNQSTKPNPKQETSDSVSRSQVKKAEETKQSVADENKFKTAPAAIKKDSPLVKNINQTLNSIELSKSFLMDIIMAEKPEEDVIAISIEDLKTNANQLNGYINQLMETEFQGKEELSDRVYTEISNVNEIIKEFNALRKKTKSLSQFKARTMDIISTKTPTGDASKTKKAEPERGRREETKKEETKLSPPRDRSGGRSEPAKSKGDFDFKFDKKAETDHSLSDKQNVFDQFNSTPAATNQKQSASDGFNNFGTVQPEANKNADPFSTFSQAGTGSRGDVSAFSAFEQTEKARPDAQKFQTSTEALPTKPFGDEVRAEAERGRLRPPEETKSQPQSTKSNFKGLWDSPEKSERKDGISLDAFEDHVEGEPSADDSHVNFNYDDEHKPGAGEFNIGQIKVTENKGAWSNFNFGNPPPQEEPQVRAEESSRELPKFGAREEPKSSRQADLFGETQNTQFSARDFDERGRQSTQSVQRDAFEEFAMSEEQRRPPQTNFQGFSTAQTEFSKKSQPSFSAFGNQPEQFVQESTKKQQQIDFDNPFESQTKAYEKPAVDVSALIARSLIAQKYEELESDRLRKERDNILSELEKVRRDYNGLKVEYDYLKRDHETMNIDFEKVKSEVQHLKKMNSDYQGQYEQLRVENENFKKLKATLIGENDTHLRQMEEMHRQINSLKEKITDYDAREKRYRNDAKIQELETLLRSTQEQFSTMQELYTKMSKELENANQELERVKTTNLKDVALSVTENLSNLLQVNLNQNFDPSIMKSPVGSSLVELKKNLIYEGATTQPLYIKSDTPPKETYANPLPQLTAVNSLSNLNYPGSQYSSQQYGYANPQLSEAANVLDRARKLRSEEPRFDGPLSLTNTPPKSQDFYMSSNYNYQPTGYLEGEKRSYSPLRYEFEKKDYLPQQEVERKLYSPVKDEDLYQRPTLQDYKYQSTSETDPRAPTSLSIQSPKFDAYNFSKLPGPGPSSTVSATEDPAIRSATELLARARKLREEPLATNPTHLERSGSPNQAESKPITHPQRIRSTSPNADGQRTRNTIIENAHHAMNQPRHDSRYSPARREVSGAEVIETNPAMIRRGRREGEYLSPNEGVTVIERPIPTISFGEVRKKSTSPIRQEEVVDVEPEPKSTKPQFQTFHLADIGKISKDQNYDSNPTYLKTFGDEKENFNSLKDDSRLVSPSQANLMKKLTFRGAKGSARGDDSMRRSHYEPGPELRIHELTGVPQVKFTLDERDYESRGDVSHRRVQSTGYEFSAAIGGHKTKYGKFIKFDFGFFDQLTNAVFANPFGRDPDNYKYACLVNKAALFESPSLQIGSITRLEGSGYDAFLRVTLYLGNKSADVFNNFGIDHLSTSKRISLFSDIVGLKVSPEHKNVTLGSKAQLKQELTLDFADFKHSSHVAQISYSINGTLTRLSVPLPFTLNKFMVFRLPDAHSYKMAWKSLKSKVHKLNYRNINAKFTKVPTDINRFCDGCLADVTPVSNPKNKTKYGGIYRLPNGVEYYLRFHMDTTRLKIMIAADGNTDQYVEWGLQYLGFLLTV